jgi:hypothetical protein
MAQCGLHDVGVLKNEIAVAEQHLHSQRNLLAPQAKH